MMKKAVVSSQKKAGEVLISALGVAPDTEEGFAELLRFEVSARGYCPRNAAIRRVQRLAAPALELDDEKTGNICDALEREGDFVVAPGGKLVASPVRFVEIVGGSFRVFSSLPTMWMKNYISGEWLLQGVRRTYVAGNNFKKTFFEAVSAIGGLILKPSAWSGLDRVTAADEKWLEQIRNRFSWESSPPGSLERDGELNWKQAFFQEGQLMWRYADTERNESLWRSRHPWMGFVSAWTNGHSPSKAPFLKLSSDEAARTCFALARVSGNPIRVTLRREKGEERLEIGAWLPIAEYRFLSLTAIRLISIKRSQTWTLPPNFSEDVCKILRDRLGVDILEESEL